ncbi:MAG: hypothetical protein ACE5JI_14730 [Acidobacteriota bacterium]
MKSYDLQGIELPVSREQAFAFMADPEQPAEKSALREILESP